MAAVVPGTFIRIAGTDPPNPPPVKIAVRNRMADRKSMYSVKGRNTAIAIGTDRPGRTPKTSPIIRPIGTTSHAKGFEASSDSASLRAARSIMYHSTRVGTGIESISSSAQTGNRPAAREKARMTRQSRAPCSTIETAT